MMFLFSNHYSIIYKKKINNRPGTGLSDLEDKIVIIFSYLINKTSDGQTIYAIIRQIIRSFLSFVRLQLKYFTTIIVPYNIYDKFTFAYNV